MAGAEFRGDPGMTLADRLKAVRQQALDGGLPVRRKDRDLYSILASCLEVCEEVVRDGLEDELREIFRVSVAGETALGPGLGTRSGGVKNLELDRSVDIPLNGAAFTLTLRFNGAGFFEVLNSSSS